MQAAHFNLKAHLSIVADMILLSRSERRSAIFLPNNLLGNQILLDLF
jgi:hypothetical protein